MMYKLIGVILMLTSLASALSIGVVAETNDIKKGLIAFFMFEIPVVCFVAGIYLVRL